jgi:hypothetical protein
MHKGRLEAFTDGVIAVIITIMVLEMKVPRGSDFAALAPTLPVFLTYVLSYTNVAIFWNNHHHMLQVSQRVDGKILWANMFSVVLAIANSLCNPLDGRDRVRRTARRGLRVYSCDGRDRLLCAGADAHPIQRLWLNLGPRGRKRFERQAFAIDQRSGDAAGLCSALDRDRALYCCCAHMVCSRLAH